MTQQHQLLDGDGRDRLEEAKAFAVRIGLARAAPGRWSVLLAVQLLDCAEWLDPYRVIHQVEALEGLRSSPMKPATLFTRERPLRGLWHQHFLQNGVATIAHNVHSALKRYGVPKFSAEIVRQVQLQGGEPGYMGAEDLPTFVDEVVQGNLDRRQEEGRMTGEWLVFAKHGGRNYYLAIANHKTGDERLRKQIELVCCREFQFLPDQLGITRE